MTRQSGPIRSLEDLTAEKQELCANETLSTEIARNYFVKSSLKQREGR